MKTLGRGSAAWVFFVIAAVLACNLLLLHILQQGREAEESERERALSEVHQQSLEAQHLASSLLRDNEALRQRLSLLTRERDSRRVEGKVTGGETGETGQPSNELEAFLAEVKERSGELAKELQRSASQALLRLISHIQNPPSCGTGPSARFMVCPVVDSCGFGCALHHVTYCFIAALSDNRTVVLEDDAIRWPYARGCNAEGRAEGWECYFEPISSCHYSDLTRSGQTKWPEWRSGSQERVTTVRFWSRPERGANFLPWASTDGDQTNDPFYMPQVVKEVLALVPHGEIGDLRAWLVGQVEKYLLRPNAATARALREIHANLARVEGSHESSAVRKVEAHEVGDWWKADWELPHDQLINHADSVGEWQHPIAGMHVRRTDHGGEAPFREVHEYLERIEAWWNSYRNAHPYVLSRLRVYLATDEPKVIAEAGKKYPQFLFLTTSHGGRSSGEGERQGTTHTQNLLSDVFHLAKCDFFVGTASSQVTRMAYERQQTHSLDRHNWRAFVSLDAPWYFP